MLLNLFEMVHGALGLGFPFDLELMKKSDFDFS